MKREHLKLLSALFIGAPGVLICLVVFWFQVTQSIVMSLTVAPDWRDIRGMMLTHTAFAAVFLVGKSMIVFHLLLVRASPVKPGKPSFIPFYVLQISAQLLAIAAVCCASSAAVLPIYHGRARVLFFVTLTVLMIFWSLRCQAASLRRKARSLMEYDENR